MAKSTNLRIKTPTASGDTSKLAVNMMLLAFGGMLIYAGWKGGSLVDVLTGAAPSQTGQGKGADESSSSNTVGGITAGGDSGPLTGVTNQGSPMAKQGTQPHGLGTFDGKPVAKWMIPSLTWARKHGWKGQVTSGYRNQSEELAAATRYGRQHYATWPPHSNHTRKDYPGGAVDVTEYVQLAHVLKGYHGVPKPVWGGPVIGDQVHFSATGH